MTHKISLEHLQSVIPRKPLGYYQDVTESGRIEDGILLIENDTYRKLVQKYSPHRKSAIVRRIVAVPYNEWPIWAKALKQFSKPEDKGIGDVVARIIGDENSTAFKAFYLKVTGRTCGCTGRQENWNLQFPLRSDATP